ncbi:hypothetical protein GYB59_14520 [bacterium]|nr:hypothetical protein [bacterium]
MRTELLVVIKKADELCTNEDEVKQLLAVNSRLSVDGDLLKLDDNLSATITISMGDLTESQERYILLALEADDPDLEQYEELLRMVKTPLYKLNGTNDRKSLEVLWDDLAAHYAHKSYPRIFAVENLMRKVITRFMVVTLGGSWSKETSPPKIKEELSKSKRSNGGNDLWELDFIHLSGYLLHPYPLKRDNSFDADLKALTKENAEEFRKNYEPRSNWERYFNDIVDMEAEELKVLWDKLYKLRCDVAHCRFIERVDFQNISEHCDKVEKVLKEALEKIDKINIPADEKESVATRGDEYVESANMIQAHRLNTSPLRHLSPKEIEEYFMSLTERMQKAMKEGLIVPQPSFNERVNTLIRDGLIQPPEDISR